MRCLHLRLNATANLVAAARLALLRLKAIDRHRHKPSRGDSDAWQSPKTNEQVGVTQSSSGIEGFEAFVLYSLRGFAVKKEKVRNLVSSLCPPRLGAEQRERTPPTGWIDVTGGDLCGMIESASCPATSSGERQGCPDNSPDQARGRLYGTAIAVVGSSPGAVY